MIPAGDGGGGGLETVVAVAEVEMVLRYLQRLSLVMLEEDDQPSQELQVAFKNPQYVEVIRKFIADPQTKSILIQRCATKGLSVICLYLCNVYVYSRRLCNGR